MEKNNKVTVHQSSEKLTWSHSRSKRLWNPLMVLQDGSRMIWAKEVTCRVESVPSEPWMSTEAPSLRQRHTFIASPVNLSNTNCWTLILLIQHVQSKLTSAKWLLILVLVFPGPGFVQKANQTKLPDLSIHWAARQAVVRISLTWVCQLEASSLLNQRSMLWDWSLHASTSLIKLSWRTLYL